MRLHLPPGGRGDPESGPLGAHSHAAGGADARVRPMAADATARPVDVLVVRGDLTLTLTATPVASAPRDG